MARVSFADVKRVGIALGWAVLFIVIGIVIMIGLSQLVPGWGGREWFVARNGVYEVIGFGLSTWIVGRLLQKYSWAELGWRTPAVTPWLRGVAIGAVMASVAIGLAVVLDGARIQFTGDWSLWPRIALPLIIGLIFAALGEEFGFRGFPLRRLSDAFGVLPAMLLLAVLFGLLHAKNPNATVFSSVNVALAAIWLSIAFFSSGGMPLAPHASGMPPDEKNAIDSQMAASATFTELNTVAFGFLACSRPNRTASNSIAGSTPNASESRRSGKPRKPNSSPSAAKIRPMMSGSAIRGHRLQSPVNWIRAPSSTTASPIATEAITAPMATPRSHGVTAGVRHPSSAHEYFCSKRPTIQVDKPKPMTSYTPLRATNHSRPPHPGTSCDRPIMMTMPMTMKRTAHPSAIPTRFTSANDTRAIRGPREWWG